MAKLRLSRRRVEEGDLPRYCIRCGRPADLVKEKTFNWHPEWVDVFLLLGCFVGLLPIGVLLGLVLNRSLRVGVPLCQRHENHWRWRWQMILALLGVILLVVVAGVVLLTLADRLPYAYRQSGPYVMLVAGGLFLVWLITAGILQNSAVRAKEITDRGITLTKVAPEFIMSLEDQRHQEQSPHAASNLSDQERPQSPGVDVRRRPSRPDDWDAIEE